MPRQRKRGSAYRIESYVEWAARIDSEVEAAARAMKPIDSPMLASRAEGALQVDLLKFRPRAQMRRGLIDFNVRAAIRRGTETAQGGRGATGSKWAAIHRGTERAGELEAQLEAEERLIWEALAAGAEIVDGSE